MARHGIRCLVLSAGLWPQVSLPQAPDFRASTNLQSIAVRVVDRKGNSVSGLTADDFTLLEDGHVQKISFFGAQHQPASVAILLDSSRSMDFGGKFDRARELIGQLIAGQHPDDQILLMPFTDRVGALQQLTSKQRQHPDLIQIPRGGIDRGTALYDALASTLCRMRTAEHLSRAVVVLTDGADQHSRLRLAQLIELARSSTPQIFVIGLFNPGELRIFQQGQKTVPLFGQRDIDNPMVVFEGLAKESAAESFFPASEGDLKMALERISEMLQTQYTLSYYPESVDRFRNIEVRVRRRGVRTIARRGVGGSSLEGPVIFQASACEVSAKDHPYPWEAKTALEPSGRLVYREDFSDSHSGWPDRSEDFPAGLSSADRKRLMARGGYKRRFGYVSGGYEILHRPPFGLTGAGSILDGIVAGYGPTWHNARASVSVQSNWTQPFRRELTPPSKDNLLSYFEFAPGLVFHLNNDGYYALVLAGGALNYARSDSESLKQFKLIRMLFGNGGQTEYSELIPWTSIPTHEKDAGPPVPANSTYAIAAEYRDGSITVSVDGRPVGRVSDSSLASGVAGLAVFGRGTAVFDDLVVESLP